MLSKTKKYLVILFKRKYIVALIIFGIWILLFDQYSLISQIKEKKHRNKLRNEKEFYLQKISADSTRLLELKTSDENLEKYAREQYLMHKPNEDVYIVIENN